MPLISDMPGEPGFQCLNLVSSALSGPGLVIKVLTDGLNSKRF